MKRRVISLMLALAMLLSMLPSAAFAAEQGASVASSSTLIDVSVNVYYRDINNKDANICIEAQLPEGSTYQDLYDLAQFPAADAHTSSLGR